MALSPYRPKMYFNDGRTLKWGKNISSEHMGALREGEIFTLLNSNNVPTYFIFMDSYNKIWESKIRRMILKSSHTLIFMWYLWALDVETQRVLRPMMVIMIDPDLSEQERYDAYVHLDENMTHLARKQDVR